MPRVGHPWRKHFYDAWFIVMEVDTFMMIILVMSWNTCTTAQVWLSWFCHKIVMDVHTWQKRWPTVTNMYHHGSVLICSVIALSASVAWQSLLLALISIDGHLHSPLVSRINVRLSYLFAFSIFTPIIILYSTCSAISMDCAHVLRVGWKSWSALKVWTHSAISMTWLTPG